MELKGVYPAMATPLTPEEKVDKASVRKVVRYLLEGGVYGLVLLGSTGEFPAMDEGMRRDLIDTALDEIKGKVPVLIGCGEPGTQRTIVQVRDAARTGADGVLIAIPYYFPLDQAAVIRHYQKVAEASSLPVCMYNFPQMTKITMAPETVAKLAAHPNIIGLKDSSSDFVAMQRILEATAEKTSPSCLVALPWAYRLTSSVPGGESLPAAASSPGSVLLYMRHSFGETWRRQWVCRKRFL